MSAPEAGYPTIDRRSESFAVQPDLAFVHELSNLPNRRALNEALETATQKIPGQFGVGFVDLDLLKKVNDDEGHKAGDLYISYAAGSLLAYTRPEDTICPVSHLGGDEFVVLVMNVKEDSLFQSIIRRVQTDLDQLGLPLSIGGRLHIPGESPSELLHAADQLMYRNKIARKLKDLDPLQAAAYLEIGDMTKQYGLDGRAAETINQALRDQLLLG